jgi:lactate racemase
MTVLLSEKAVKQKITDGLNQLPLSNKRVLVLIPDPTRTMPLPLFFRTIVATLKGRVAQLDFMVALGTHPELSQNELLSLVGLTEKEKETNYPNVNLFNHAWQDPEMLTSVGEISLTEIEQISGGMLHESVNVRLNRLILDYDHLLVCGPVFPHEVVGFSGGNKYFFPGIAGQDIINLSHWMGALMTSYAIIGTKNTPVRQLIDKASALIPRPRSAICCVVTPDGVAGLYCGTPEEAWSQAAVLSAKVHVHLVEHAYQTVLSVMPAMYTEIWTGAKGMYKLEPVVADGGELIIFAPHIHEFSEVHGTYIRQIGYHVRDYFVKQPDKFNNIPAGVKAHSTHLRGLGSFDPITGIENPRIRVTLSTGISEADCHAVNLDYRDPASINLADWSQSQDENLLVVPRAGEFLYRIKTG